MNNEIKETNLIIRERLYNGDYGVGSIFVNEQQLNVQQLLNNPNQDSGIIKYSKNIGICADLNLGSNLLANIKTEIPFIVSYDKLKIFNDTIDEIKNNLDYKYNESHYIKDRFDPKRLEYFDIIIDGEEYESNNKELYKKFFKNIIDVENASKLMDEYNQNLVNALKK